MFWIAICEHLDCTVHRMHVGRRDGRQMIDEWSWKRRELLASKCRCDILPRTCCCIMSMSIVESSCRCLSNAKCSRPTSSARSLEAILRLGEPLAKFVHNTAVMNDYEARRLEKIKRNQALLAELNVKPVVPKQARNADGRPPPKKRKVLEETAPARTSARIAATPVKPTYNDDVDIKAVKLPRSAPKKRTRTKVREQLGSTFAHDTEPLLPSNNVEEIKAGWTAWEVAAALPTRDHSKVFHFEDYPYFTPNKSPKEMLQEGCFGGSYYRALRTRKLSIVAEGDWEELPKDWLEDLNVERYLVNPKYNPNVNKFKASCGQSIEEWEAAGWISHEHDVRGWFQWYTRFFQGRRCDDDDRQVSRWKKCVGETGRWRRMLLKKYMQLGVREVFDDGVDEDTPEVSPVMHQTCHHWGFEVRQDLLDAFWASGGK